MEINFVAVVVCAVLAMVVGAIWYGPLFGRTWMKIIGVSEMDAERQKEMQRRAMPLYAIQFLLTLLQVYILVHYIKGWEEASGIENALWIWLGFIMPTIAGAAMWNNNSRGLKWAQFLIQAGYQLVCFVLFGYILGTWG